jgi:WD40 repeat protein
VEVLHQVVHEAPTPPRRLKPDIPANLEAICLRCLQKVPAQRYASAADLAEALHRHRTGQPIAEPTFVRPKPIRNYRRRQIWISACAILAVLGGIGLAWRFWPTSETRPITPSMTDTLGKDLGRSPTGTRNLTNLGKVDPVTIPWGTGKLLCLAFSQDGQTVALGGESTTVELRDVRTGELRADFAGHPGNVFSLAFSADGKTLAAGSYKQVWLWDMDSHKERGILRGHEANVAWVGFTSGDKTLNSLGPGDLKVWDVNARQKKGGLDDLGGHLEISPDGKYLAEVRTNVFAHACHLYLWELATAKKVRTLNVKYQHFAFAPDSRTMVGGAGAELRVLEVPSAQERGGHSLHTKDVFSVAISPDGQMLASGSHDHTAILWNIATKKEHVVVKGHTGPVRVRFSPDGRTLVTGSSADAFVKLWDVASGEERTALLGHTAGVVAFRFSSDGRTLAVVGRDETVKLWPLPS